MFTPKLRLMAYAMYRSLGLCGICGGKGYDDCPGCQGNRSAENMAESKIVQPCPINMSNYQDYLESEADDAN